MALPDYIDNTPSRTLQETLIQLIEKEDQKVLDIATGFFRIEAWLRLEGSMHQLQSLRLLIGRDPSIRPAESDRIDLVRHFKREVQKQVEKREFNVDYKNQITRLIQYLEREDVQVRLFGALGDRPQFLHAKAYIFDQFSIVGSSNFTPSGLSGNTELNIINKIGAIARDLRENWFIQFWEHESVDTEYKAKLIDALNASKFGSKPYTPYQIFIKALYERFKDDTILDGGLQTGLNLASFQQEGFERAVRLLERHNGCIVADAVGLGKTFIGLRVIEHYLIKLRRPGNIPKALVLCPAQLRDLVWRKKLDEFGIKADIISHEEISRNDFDLRRFRNHDLIVVDESHSFRNSATNRYRNLQKMLGTGRLDTKVLLLTATPINNNIFDLYHQILLLTKGNEVAYRDWGVTNLSTYFKSLKDGKTEITDLLMETMVRRSRQDVIKRQQAGEEIRIAGTLIQFPTRQLEKFTYNFEENFAGLYEAIADKVDSLNLAPYNIKAFKKKKGRGDEGEVKRNKALVYLQKALYFKRFESSLVAFSKTLQNQCNFQTKFYEILTQENKLLDSGNFRKLLMALDSDDDQAAELNIINNLEAIATKDYDIDQLKEQIEADLKSLNDILGMLDKIRVTTESQPESDRKLTTFKKLLVQLRGQKILVFSYFKDTAKYIYDELMQDKAWLGKMTHDGKTPVIDILTGDSSGKQREEKVRHFAPKANTQDEEERQYCLDNPIDILICTDVLSEGQNLQDAGVLVNYDLHWNPVRMIQRAGRIDRLGTDFDRLYIYNCFPEEGLEKLLGLVRRLQERIATIDREVGLDASVLGESISERSLDELYRLKKADSEAEKRAILEELENEAELISLDEMRFPLLQYLQKFAKDQLEEIPLGIHSTYNFKIPDPNFKDGGIFFAFRAGDRHFWHCYPRIQGAISTDPDRLVSSIRKIYSWIECQESDFPAPEELPPTQFDAAVFAVFEGAIRNILQSLRKRVAIAKLAPKLTKYPQNIFNVLTQLELLDAPLSDQNAGERVLEVIKTMNLRSYTQELKSIWEQYVQDRDINNLVSTLDELFLENEYYNNLEPEQESPEGMLKAVTRQDIELICYEWIKPQVQN
ncbi:SNF2-related protein [Picosynechococcus sp. NKBG15041c]|uniref:SNF2-related protein n=1 Tax=Picosynechococcus sp. NKBG15041c TaxID=1407650 RepID=UPI0003FDF3E8|nr:SNF2-related protein [Picosynechococcus sp. NKBG15041c]